MVKDELDHFLLPRPHLIPYNAGSMYWASRLHTARSCFELLSSHAFLFDVLLDFAHPSLIWPAALPSPLHFQGHRYFSDIESFLFSSLEQTTRTSFPARSLTFIPLSSSLRFCISFPIQLCYSTRPHQRPHFRHSVVTRPWTVIANNEDVVDSIAPLTISGGRQRIDSGARDQPTLFGANVNRQVSRTWLRMIPNLYCASKHVYK